MIRLRFVLALLAGGALAACGPAPGRKPVRYEISGTREERVARATTILSKYCRLPGPLSDAHMAEDVHDNSDGWVPGPSDSSLTGVLSLPADDLPKWREALSPRWQTTGAAVTPDAPVPALPWWPAPEAFADGERYTPQTLTGRREGFVVLLPGTCAVCFSVF